MRPSLNNYVLFQIGWFSCVVGAANGRPALGFMVAIIISAIHLMLANKRRNEAILLLFCALTGTVFDSLLLATGWIAYPSGEWLPGLAPYWIVAMWILFGTTLNLSMGWMRGRPWLAILMGAAGGPLSYLAGARLGAMELLEPVYALTALGVAWGIIMPMLAAAAVRLNGFATTQPPSYVQTDWRDKGISGHA